MMSMDEDPMIDIHDSDPPIPQPDIDQTLSEEVDINLNDHDATAPLQMVNSSATTEFICPIYGYQPNRTPINEDLARTLRCGSRIRMYWPPDDSWSNGEVTYNYNTGMYRVQFEDDNARGPMTYCLAHYDFTVLKL